MVVVAEVAEVAEVAVEVVGTAADRPVGSKMAAGQTAGSRLAVAVAVATVAAVAA